MTDKDLHAMPFTNLNMLFKDIVDEMDRTETLLESATLNSGFRTSLIAYMNMLIKMSEMVSNEIVSRA